MYIILTSKLGEYDARPGQGISPVEAYEYFFYGKKKADFTIAEVGGDQGRVSIVEAGEGGTTNSVPLKFFERFDTVEAARAELEQLVTFGSIDARLERVAL
ncbi:ferredoxin [Billgrantia desiderata]|uniref:Ferredoxin n=1 Tax=Billgrantia desiderata TaxID=52021 RepID=A0ABS9B5L1_9GAMM|nr:ferredoxin [Halomonas desiderata]MCE8013040.1 ferredoxin [Halomonas desiderata]MCE8042657.1 ferredoxin [Halomonas desiderata]MCE8047232.1 ferredoxin [Halomonas desiderata]